MNAKQCIQHGNKFPYDATDEWWMGSGKNLPEPIDAAHRTARGIIADLQDRRGIKNQLDDVDEEIHVRIVKAIADIIREGMKCCIN